MRTARLEPPGLLQPHNASNRPVYTTAEKLIGSLTIETQDSLGCVDLVLAAWRIKLREQFDEIICLSRLRGLRRLDYQIETALKVLRNFRGRALLADEVGLGKTIEAGIIISEFMLRGLAKKTLILTPAALVGQWRSELSEKFDIKASTSEEEVFRLDPENAWVARDGHASHVLIASLQMARSERHRSIAQSQGWDMVVVDEAHHLKNRVTAGFKLVDEIKSRYLLLLTATPIENDLEELYNLVTLLKPGQLSTPAAFKREYVEKGDPFLPRNRERLRQLLSEVMVRNTRALAGRSIELPPRFAQTIVVEPETAEAALYQTILETVRLSQDLDGLKRMALRSVMEQAGSSAQAVSTSLEHAGDMLPMSILARLRTSAVAACAAPSRKAIRLLEMLGSLPSLAGGCKAIVFTRYKATLEMLAKRLSEAGISYCEFHGGMSGPQKDKAVERLNGEVGVMLATEVGGEGCNLQSANVLINYDLPWNPMKIEQRIGRVHRIGQTREVHIFSLCAKGSAEERILDVLERRIHLFELVIGEVDLILGQTLDEEEFESRLFDIYLRSRDESQVSQEFDKLAKDLEAARGHYEKVKALDEALFKRDFET